MAGHVLGMTETFTGYRNLVRDMRAAEKLKGDGPQVDGLTAQQVAFTAGLTTTELIGRLGRRPAQRPLAWPSPGAPDRSDEAGDPRQRARDLADGLLVRHHPHP